MKYLFLSLLFFLSIIEVSAQCTITVENFSPSDVCLNSNGEITLQTSIQNPVVTFDPDYDFSPTLTNTNDSCTINLSFASNQTGIILLTVTDTITNTYCDTSLELYSEAVENCDFLLDIERIRPTCAGDDGIIIISSSETDFSVNFDGAGFDEFSSSHTINGLSQGDYHFTYKTASVDEEYTYHKIVYMQDKLKFRISNSGLKTLCGNEEKELRVPPAESYLWSTGDTTRIITINTPGYYAVTITNPEEDYCNTTASIDISYSPQMNFTFFDTKNADCFDECSGGAVFGAEGGTPPLLYITHFAEICYDCGYGHVSYDGTVTGLCASDLSDPWYYTEYEVKVRDSLGCQITSYPFIVFQDDSTVCNRKIAGHVGFKTDCGEELDTVCVNCKVVITDIEHPELYLYAFTNQEGNYSFSVDTGNYVLSLDTLFFNAAYQVACPSNNQIEVVINSEDQLIEDKDFYFEIPTDETDVALLIPYLQNPRPENNFEMNLVCRNLGSDTNEGILNIHYNPTVADSIVNTNLTPLFIDTENGLIQFDVANLQIGESKDIRIEFYTSASAMIGDLFCVSADISIAGDTEPQNDSVYICKGVVNSWDPNEITVHQLSNGNEFDGGNVYSVAGVREFDEVQYTIYFQNTGNAPAFDVEVVDSIDVVNLDISSLKFISASHAYQANITDNVLKCTFENIFLPDSTHNEKASHGFVSFSVKLKPSATEVIKNKAFIYFDNNASVVTNEPALTPVFDNDGDGFVAEDDCDDNDYDVNPNQEEIPDNDIDDNCNGEIDEIILSVNAVNNVPFEIYPNPTRAFLYLKSNKKIEEVKVFNLFGEEVQTSFMDNNRLNMVNLSVGTYMIRISISDKIYFVKVTKI